MRKFMRKRTLKKFGLNEQDYENILKEQNFRCAICEKHISQFKSSLSIDHDHSTNRVRGLLCPRCNYYLVGNKTLEELTKVIKYLEREQYGQGV